MGENECLYVVLIKALTKLGKFSRKLKHYEYTHIAICLNDELNDFVTFSRKKHYSPFDAGFMHEKIEHYAFGENKEVKVKIYKLPVKQQNMEKIKKYISNIENDNEYIFNLYSMITMPLFHGISIYKAHNCMSFVCKIIELSDVIELKKKYYKYDIKDMDELLDEFFYKECNLQKTKEDNGYMEKVNIIVGLKLFFKLNGKLIYRIIMKRKYMKNNMIGDRRKS